MLLYLRVVALFVLDRVLIVMASVPAVVMVAVVMMAVMRLCVCCGGLYDLPFSFHHSKV